ncbi:MAG: LSM domain-containing protein [Candidatus Njordarchaeales archaeon]
MEVRPLEILSQFKNKRVLVKLKGNVTVSGILLAFDLHLNISLSNVNVVGENRKFDYVFIRGDSVLYVSPVV